MVWKSMCFCPTYRVFSGQKKTETKILDKPLASLTPTLDSHAVRTAQMKCAVQDEAFPSIGTISWRTLTFLLYARTLPGRCLMATSAQRRRFFRSPSRSSESATASLLLGKLGQGQRVTNNYPEQPPPQRPWKGLTLASNARSRLDRSLGPFAVLSPKTLAVFTSGGQCTRQAVTHKFSCLKIIFFCLFLVHFN